MTEAGILTIRGGAPLRGTLALPGCKGVSHRALIAAAVGGGGERAREPRHRARRREHPRRPGSPRRRDHRHRRRPGAGARAGVRRPGRAHRGPRLRELGHHHALRRRALRGPADFLSVLVGDASLSQRPMARVVDPLRAMGAAVDGRDGGRLAPLTVRGGRLHGIRHDLAVASGQVKTALVLAGLQADGHHRDRGAGAEPGPHRAAAARRSAPRSRWSTTAPPASARAGAALRPRHPRRPVVGRVLRGRRRDRAGVARRARGRAREPGPHRVPRRAAGHGGRHRRPRARRAGAASRWSTSRCRRTAAGHRDPQPRGDRRRAAGPRGGGRVRRRCRARSSTRPSCG